MKKYRVIAKVGNDKFVKHNVNNLVKYTDYLNKTFGGFRWMNVYKYIKGKKGEQLANFTSKNPPKSAYLKL